MAAGCGARNNRFLNLHKALLPLANRPIISHILDCIDPSVEVVIALGYLQAQLRSYLEYVYPSHNFIFVMVDNYDGPGSGPGYSLLQCQKHLRCPFIFTSIDTVFNAKLEQPIDNWVGVATLTSGKLASYCFVDIAHNGYVRKFYYNSDECLGNDVFIGIAGIYEYDNFWHGLANRSRINNEHQVINGFAGLAMVTTKKFEWYDTGTDDCYEATTKHFPQPITVPKKDEILYIDCGKVVKFFSDSQKIENRCLRATALNKMVPSISRLSKHIYGYEYVTGTLLSHVYDETVLDRFIDFCRRFFVRHTSQIDGFMVSCDRMYRIKTHERTKSLEDTEIDLIEKVNGIPVPSIRTLLKQVDWDRINNKAIPFSFHGDFQPENIIINWDKIILLDWRDSFGGNMMVGDLYYDLAKLYHALVVSGTNIVDGKFTLEIHGSNAFINIDSRHNLLLLLEKLRVFCLSEGYDWEHVKLLATLQYISIASLYEDIKYKTFLFLFGKLQLTKHLGKLINA